MIYVVAALLSVAAAVTIMTVAWSQCIELSAPPAWLWGIVAGLWIAVGVAIGAWLLMCALDEDCPCPTECDWLSLAWIAAASSAFTAWYIAGCCGGVIVVLAAALGAAALGAFLLWYFACKPTWCYAIKLLALMLITMTIPLLGYLAAVSAIRACGNNYVAAITGTLSIVIGAVGLFCDEGERYQN